MIRSPQELSETIKKAVNRQAVFASHLLLAGAMAFHTFTDPSSTTFQRGGTIASIIAIFILIGLRVIDFVSINNHPLLAIIIYHILCFVGIAFVADPTTPYILIWFIPLILANLYYGRPGIWVSVCVFVLMAAVKFVYAVVIEDIATTQDINNLIVTPIVMIAIALFFLNIQKVYDRDYDDLKQTTRYSLLEQQRLEVLINNMSESVFVLNSEGRITLYNAASLALLDTNTSLKDKLFDEAVHITDEKDRSVNANDLMASNVTRNDIMIHYSEDDAAAISLTVTRIRTSFGKTDEDSFIITMRDITHQKSLEEERDEFVSVISHELRTPVTITEAGISNAMFVNKQGGDPKAVHDSLESAHQQALYLASMLNDLSTFARAERGALELDPEEISPTELITSMADDYRSKAEQKGLKLERIIDQSTPKTIVSSRLYIHEILQNFISNSLKYTDTGAVTVKVEASEHGVKFSVSDTGIGLSVSDQKKIFNKFYRAEDYRTRSTSGSGLGLYIVKKLTALIRGKIDVESKKGEGSTFSLYVPDLRDQFAEKLAREERQEHELESIKNGASTPEKV